MDSSCACQRTRLPFSARSLRRQLHPAADGRSLRACEALAAEGYSSLVNMRGGFSGARDKAGNVQQVGWEGLGFGEAHFAIAFEVTVTAASTSSAMATTAASTARLWLTRTESTLTSARVPSTKRTGNGPLPSSCHPSCEL